MKFLIKFFTIVAAISMTACSVPKSPGLFGDTLRGLTNTCSLKCPSKAAPVANPNHQRSFNGCGSKGIIVDPRVLPSPQFEQCCNNHDYCYDTCNIKKDDCDTAFRNCMLIACENAISCQAVVCNADAESFYNIVKTLGCSSYLDAQKSACICN